MGQATSKQQTQMQLFLNNYTLESKCDLGIILIHKVTKDRFLLKELSLMDQNEYNSLLERYRIKKKYLRENILNLVEVEGKINTSFCSGTFKIFLIFQYPNITLFDQIKARNQQSRYFEQQDLWSIMQSCLNGISQLVQTLLLDTKKIFIMNDGSIKIMDADIINDGSKFILSQGVYYSPERLKNFTKTNRGNSSQKQMMFSLGMSMLNTSLLSDCVQCYDYQNLTFNVEILNSKKQKLNNLYSKQLNMAISSLLEPNPNRRSSIVELQDAINEFWKQQNKVVEQIEDKQEQNNKFEQDQQQEQYQEKQQEQIKNQEQQKVGQQNNTQIKAQETNLTSNTINQKQNIENKSRSELSHQIKVENNSYSLNNFLANIQNNKNLMNNTSQYNNYYLNNNFKNNAFNVNPYSNTYKYKENLDFSSNNSYYKPYNYIQTPQFQYYNPLPNNYYPSTTPNNQKLFTDPKLLENLKRDLVEINQRKSFLQQPSSYYQNNYQSQYQFKQSTINNISNTSNLINTKIENDQNYSKNFYNTSAQSTYKPQNEFIVQIYDDGRRYQGRAKNGLKQGKGKLIYADGAYYQGNFSQNKMHGYGILYYGSGTPAYQGYWNSEQFHGNGTLYNQNPICPEGSFDFRDFNQVEDFWTRYQGNFEFDNKHGFGKLYLANNEYFEGEFFKDCMNGKGTFYDIYNKSHEGIWQDNIFRQYL